MTKQETIANHRKMWNWIADETLRQGRKIGKMEYFEAMGYKKEDIPVNKCFCCEYGNDALNKCKKCPIDFSDNHCLEFYSPYKKWLNSFEEKISYKQAAKYARIIANLPERE